MSNPYNCRVASFPPHCWSCAHHESDEDKSKCQHPAFISDSDIDDVIHDYAMLDETPQRVAEVCYERESDESDYQEYNHVCDLYASKSRAEYVRAEAHAEFVGRCRGRLEALRKANDSKIVEELRAELAANAAMLAKQTDLARQAEMERDEMQSRVESLTNARDHAQQVLSEEGVKADALRANVAELKEQIAEVIALVADEGEPVDMAANTTPADRVRYALAQKSARGLARMQELNSAQAVLATRTKERNEIWGERDEARAERDQARAERDKARKEILTLWGVIETLTGQLNRGHTLWLTL